MDLNWLVVRKYLCGYVVCLIPLILFSFEVGLASFINLELKFGACNCFKKRHGLVGNGVVADGDFSVFIVVVAVVTVAAVVTVITVWLGWEVGIVLSEILGRFLVLQVRLFVKTKLLVLLGRGLCFCEDIIFCVLQGGKNEDFGLEQGLRVVGLDLLYQLIQQLQMNF